MADGVKEVRFWHGWPKYSQEFEAFGGDCIDPVKILFNGGQIAMSDDSAVDPDASPPVQENCCCCAECMYCLDTKKPSMVKVVFSGVADGNLCSVCDEQLNGTVYELYCSRSGNVSFASGTCCYELSIVMTGCTYDSLIYCIHGLFSGDYSPFVQLSDLSVDPVNIYDDPGPTYDIDCESSQTLTEVDDTGEGDLCDWSGASVTVTPYDCDDY